MRILNVITGLGPGGAEAMLVRIVTSLDRKRFEPAVVSLLDGGVRADALSRAGIDVSTLGMRRRAADPRGLWRLIRTIRRWRPDLIQSWLYHADVLSTLAAMPLRVPVVWNIRCSNMQTGGSSVTSAAVVRSGAILSPVPRAIIVNSDAGRKEHELLGYRPRTWHVIPNGFDTERFQPSPASYVSVRRELGLSDDVLVVGMLARLDPMKDHATWATAAVSVLERLPNVHFVAAGENVTPEAAVFRSLLDDVRSAGRVHLLGYRSDVSRLAAAFDLAVLSSAYGEGFPNVVGEAMSCGVPCVVTDVGDAARIVGDTGLVVPPRSPRALADAVYGMLSRPAEERRILGRAARHRVIREYDLASIVRRYEELYETMRNERSQG